MSTGNWCSIDTETRRHGGLTEQEPEGSLRLISVPQCLREKNPSEVGQAVPANREDAQALVRELDNALFKSLK